MPSKPLYPSRWLNSRYFEICCEKELSVPMPIESAICSLCRLNSFSTLYGGSWVVIFVYFYASQNNILKNPIPPFSIRDVKALCGTHKHLFVFCAYVLVIVFGSYMCQSHHQSCINFCFGASLYSEQVLYTFWTHNKR